LITNTRHDISARQRRAELGNEAARQPATHRERST
jgi:hypothetical protein